MASLNLVFFMGNLGQTPELKTTPKGKSVCELNVASTHIYYDKNGEKVEETEWKTVEVWDTDAENACAYLKKGRGVFVEGRLKTKKWDDKETGKKMQKTIIVARKGGLTYLPKSQERSSQQEGYGQRGDYGNGNNDDVGF